MAKGERRLLKELDMCRIIKDIKTLQIESDKLKPVNPLAALLGSNIRKAKHQVIDMDNSSDEDLPLMEKLKRSMFMNVKLKQKELIDADVGADAKPPTTGISSLLKPKSNEISMVGLLKPNTGSDSLNSSVDKTEKADKVNKNATISPGQLSLLLNFKPTAALEPSKPKEPSTEEKKVDIENINF